MISAKAGIDSQSNKWFAGYMRGRWVMGYAVGADMRLKVLPEIAAANWYPCITLDRSFDMRAFDEAREGFGREGLGVERRKKVMPTSEVVAPKVR